MPSVDVAVVGAGPAGVSAALHLRRAGLDVLVVDRARFPRDKCCGDGLTTLALRELELLGLDPGAVAGWTDVTRAMVRGPGGREVALPLPPPGSGRFAAVTPRQDLDAALVALARAGGVTVADGHALVDAEAWRPDRITLAVEGLGEVSARYAVGADGMW